MRLFVAVRPPEPVLDRLASLVVDLRDRFDRRSEGGLRWTSRDQWHVTLRFLGEVDDPQPIVSALERAALSPTRARLGPGLELLGQKVVCAPVAGLEELAGHVVGATAQLGEPPEGRAFRGHVTLARLRRGRRVIRSRDLDGAEVEASWPVDEVALVRSHLGSSGPRYEDLFIRRLLP